MNHPQFEIVTYFILFLVNFYMS